MKNKTELFVLLMIMTQCTAPQRISMFPISQSAKLESGQQIATGSQSGIDAEARYFGMTDTLVCFDIRIENHSNKNLEVNPARFYIRYRNLDGTTSNNRKHIQAIDPEKKIPELIREANERRQNEKIVGTIFGVLTLAAAIATIASDDHESGRDFHPTIDMMVNLGHRVPPPPPTPSKIEHWQCETLKITTLKPGYHIRGVIYFPVNKAANLADIVIPVDGEKIHLRFQQKLESKFNH